MGWSTGRGVQESDSAHIDADRELEISKQLVLRRLSDGDNVSFMQGSDPSDFTIDQGLGSARGLDPVSELRLAKTSSGARERLSI